MKRRTFIARTATAAASTVIGAAVLPSLAAQTLTEIEAFAVGEDLSAWQSRMIYFVMIDRFANGDSNNLL